jgi:hypothetical protein
LDAEERENCCFQSAQRSREPEPRGRAKLQS